MLTKKLGATFNVIDLREGFSENGEMLDTAQNIDVISGSERSFGFTFAILFALVSIYHFINGNELYWASLIITINLLFISVVKPSILKIPNKLWFRFGIILGSIIAPVVMGIVYWVAVVPIGLVFRLLNKDLLNSRSDSAVQSYWNVRSEPLRSMKFQF